MGGQQNPIQSQGPRFPLTTLSSSKKCLLFLQSLSIYTIMGEDPSIAINDIHNIHWICVGKDTFDIVTTDIAGYC